MTLDFSGQRPSQLVVVEGNNILEVTETHIRGRRPQDFLNHMSQQISGRIVTIMKREFRGDGQPHYVIACDHFIIESIGSLFAAGYHHSYLRLYY